MVETIQSITERFFALMGIALDEVKIETEEEKRRIYRVAVKSPDSKLLIGVHGATLEQIRVLLTRLVERTIGKSFLIHLEVNDYLQAKDERLFRNVDAKIESLMRTGWEVALGELNNYERKKIHNYVAEKNVEGLSTKSVGEDAARTLHLIYSGAPKRVTAPTTSPSLSLAGLSEDGIGI